MSNTIIIIIMLSILFYLICSTISYGMILAFAQRIRPDESNEKYDYHRKIAYIISLFGPLVILSVIISTGFKYGFKLEKREKVGTKWYDKVIECENRNKKVTGNRKRKYKDIWED